MPELCIFSFDTDARAMSHSHWWPLYNVDTSFLRARSSTPPTTARCEAAARKDYFALYDP